MANISGIETIKSASDAAGILVLNDANNATSSVTVDVTANTSAAFSLNASAENDGTIVYLGGAGADTVVGSTGADTIGGGAGADTITGGNGGDSITGGAAADTFTYTAVAQSTGTARDTVTDFTSGTDKLAVTLDSSSSTAALTFDATVQTAQAGASALAANLSGSIGQAIYDTTNSKLVINANADNLVTTLDYQIDMTAAATAANTVQAGDINFTVSSGSGADTIVTGAGADTITGGAGADNITAGTGIDTVTGGTGLDTIALGAGGDVDTVLYTTTSDGGTAGSDSDGDTITGFVSTEDVFKLDGALATALDDIADNTALAFATAGINDGNTGAAVGASLTADNEMLFLDTSNSNLAAASLGDVSAVATALEAQITLTAATGNDGLIVVESSDTAGKAGVYFYLESGTNQNQFDAAELSVLAIITADDVLAADFITT
jgi:Ca2+-binding RTX toxin-like protein